MYEYDQNNDFNRFINLDGIESKLVQHLMSSTSKYADQIWKILKYPTKEALSMPSLTEKEKKDIIHEIETDRGRISFSPFVYDGQTDETTTLRIFVNSVYPIDHLRSDVFVNIQVVVHSNINILYGDADTISNPDGTNANDYYFSNDESPAVIYKSRATTLLKCILAEFNGLYIDGIGYLQFNNSRTADNRSMRTSSEFDLFNGHAFFGYSIKLGVTMSGISDSGDYGF